jgi:putative nucleotidyltransferase with HDIG domain
MHTKQRMKSRIRLPFARLAELGRRLRVERFTVVAIAACFVASLAVVLATTELQSLAERSGASSWSAGMNAPRDFVVERDFKYVDENATQSRRDAQAALVPPVFDLNVALTAAALASFDRFAGSLLRHVRQGSSLERTFLTLQVEFPETITRADLRSLLAIPDLPRALESGRELLSATLSRGIVDLAAHRGEAADAGAVEISREQGGGVQSETVPIEQVATLDTVLTRAGNRLVDDSMGEPQRRAALLLLQTFMTQNAFYDAETTQLRRNRARAEVEPVVEKLARGQVLVRRGDLITDVTALKIKALGDFARTGDINAISGSVLFLLLIFALGVYLLSIKSATIVLKRGHVLLTLAMAVVYLALSGIAVRFVPIPEWMPVSVVIPTSAMSMLVAILVSTPVGVFFSLLVSLSLLLLPGMGLQSFFFAFLSGIAATAVVLNAEKRIDLIRAGLFLSLLDVLILLVLGLQSNYQLRTVLGLLGMGLANGFSCGILTLGFLPIFELLLNAPTRFKLMELSDLNAPIFKRMLSQAPGTYTHSISVANLAETACEAIGANAMLARVSAYYHDIGKVDQADYFVENQKTFNRHDEMRPSLSAAVIKSHVRIGIEKARQLKLPQAIIDIIAQHHGQGLITFFYHRAVKEGKNPRLSRDDYSYPGVRPRTKEAAVLMLADTVEAASRTLKHPTEVRLERFVQDMIMEKFNSGELGDSNLTLRDLELIRKSFVHILEGYFHTRIEYPKLAQARGAKQ